MKLLLQNTSHTIGVGKIENQDNFVPIMIVDAGLLKELTKLMASYEPKDYEIGTIVKADGEKVLTLKPYSETMKNTKAGFLLAGRQPKTKEEKAKKDQNQKKLGTAPGEGKS